MTEKGIKIGKMDKEVVLMVSSNYISGSFRISEILYYAFSFSAWIAYDAGFPAFSKWIGVILSLATSILLAVFCWRSETRLVDMPHVKELTAAGFSMTVWYVFERIKWIGGTVSCSIWGNILWKYT